MKPMLEVNGRARVRVVTAPEKARAKALPFAGGARSRWAGDAGAARKSGGRIRAALEEDREMTTKAETWGLASASRTRHWSYRGGPQLASLADHLERAMRGNVREISFAIFYFVLLSMLSLWVIAGVLAPLGAVFASAAP
jgi:hypothetical protein